MTIFIIDFETTGLNPYHNKLIEVAIKVHGTEKQYTSLINIRENLTEKITEITNITNEMLSSAPSTRSVYKEFIEFINNNLDDSDNYMIAHNGLTFDFIFLKRIYETLDIDIPTFKYVDTLLMSRYLHPRLNSHKMSTLCHKNIYNVQNDSEHRAMSDVRTLEKIYDKLITKSKLNIHDIYEIIHL